jgi:hypothetical protein
MADRYDNWDSEIDPRIEKLTRNGFYLEAFYLYSATLEHCLQDAIRYQEEWVKHTLQKSSLRFETISPENLKEKTLGQLISLFARYCADTDLISKLHEFNSSRKKFVHRILDHSMKELDSEAKSKTKTYNELVSKVSRYNVQILNKKIKAHRRKINTLQRDINSIKAQEES